MVMLRRPLEVAHVRTDPTSGNRVIPLGGGTCDKCTKKLNSYNTSGRCHACGIKYGWPEEVLTIIEIDKTRRYDRRNQRRGHKPDCECWDRRFELRGAARADNPNWKVYVIEVTCPECLKLRHVRSNGHRVALCQVDYKLRCSVCSQRGPKKSEL
jgi:hypothetical protein